MFPDSTDSNKRVHSRKKAPKLKYQKLDVHKLTGKFYEGKGYVCVVKILHRDLWWGLFMVSVVHGNKLLN